MLNAKELIAASVAESIETKQQLVAKQSEQIENCGQLLAAVYDKGGKILFCGNGGSAADCQHIAAELVIRFRSKINRAALPAIALTVDPSMMSAGGNDIGFENVFARLVEAYGKSGDALVAISTSGNSENVIRAVNTAKEQGVLTIGLLGGNGGKLLPLCDYSVVVPSEVTARIQESHILIGHIWCEIIEETIFPELF
ncbi:MAG: SIS domain-containing protein [Candidatus Kapabacteria bacterium]|nr:SIS domain-containing protein [Candidatus Kapabacteria bacterium]